MGGDGKEGASPLKKRNARWKSRVEISRREDGLCSGAWEKMRKKGNRERSWGVWCVCCSWKVWLLLLCYDGVGWVRSKCTFTAHILYVALVVRECDF